MSNEVILNLSFDNQTVTDLTGNWILDGTPNATYEQIDGRDGYSLVTGTLGTPLILVAVDQEAIYNEYTIDFNLYVKPSYTDGGWFSFLNLESGMNYSGDYKAYVDNGLTINLEIGGSDREVSIDTPTSKWVHITIISEYDSDTGVSTAYLYVDSVLRTYRQDLHHNGSPFAIGKKLVLFNRGGSSFYFPNTPGLATDGLTVRAGIHVPNQKPAISLLNLSRVFNNFCTWLKGQLSTVAFTGSYDDLSNKPTISTVNDGTLTIQRNGTTVDTFTANSSTDKTVNIQCVDLSTAQTVAGVKTFTSNMVIQGGKKVLCNLDNSYIELDGGTAWGKGGSIVLSGQDRSSYSNAVLIVSKSDTNTDILQYQNGELKPLWNNTSDSSLGTSTNQWKSVYSQTYYYNGTAWGLDKVNEWTDTNTFSKTNSDTIQLKNGRVAIGETISSDTFTQFSFKDKNTDNLAYIRNNYIANGTNNLDFYVRNKYSSGSPSTTGSVVYTFFGLSLDNTGKSYARLKGDFYPYTNNVYSLGTSTNKWSKVYSDDVVHTTGNETISGIKSFKDIIVRNVGNFTTGEAPTAQTSCLVLKHTNSDSTQNANAILSYMFTTGETMCELTQNPCIGSIARTWFRTSTDGSYSIYSYTRNGALGIPGYKWKDVQTEKINSLNPGALSLPGTSVNVDTTDWVLDGSNVNIYTPTSDGWLGIQATDTVYDQMHYVFVGRTGGGNTYYQQNVLSPINALWDSKYHGCVFIPVVKGQSYHIRCICSTIVARFYPCQGNVQGD